MLFGRIAEGDPMDCDGKSDSSPEREHCDDHLKGADGSDSNKKRKRKPYRPGERTRERKVHLSERTAPLDCEIVRLQILDLK